MDVDAGWLTGCGPGRRARGADACVAGRDPGHVCGVLFDHDAGKVQDHSADGVEDAVLILEPRVDAPAVAREFLAAHRDDLADALYEDAELLISELVTNAVAHGRTAMASRVRASPPGIGIAVADSGASIPPSVAQSPTSPGSSATHGRGLAIVAALATAWGVEPADPPPGKTVWFELHATDSTA